MKSEIASIHERLNQGGDWRAFQQEIATLHTQAETEEEFVVLLEAHRNLVAWGEHTFDRETYAKILPITRAEYLMFLNREAMEGGEHINPMILDRITAREVEEGRMDPDDEFRTLAHAGGSVLGDTADLDAHACRNGTWFFYGMAGAALVAWLLTRAAVPISPLWLILAGLLIGWFFNERERLRIKREIAERRAQRH